MKVLNLIIFSILVTMVGCRSVDVSKLNLEQRTVSSCAHIYVTDSRPYIVSSDKKPSFVGIVRGGYGNPFDFSTSSGKPLAEELGIAIQRSLSGAKYVSGANVSTSNGEGCKTVVLNLKEWKIDTYVDSWFMTDAELKVYSDKGSILASKTLTDKRAVDGSFWNQVGAARKNFLNETKRAIGELLGDSQVSTALSK